MQGKVYVVTGVTGSLGGAVAQALAQTGATVALVCRDQRRGEAVRSAIGQDSSEVFTGDLSSLESVRGLASQLRQRYPFIDGLVNNAAVYKKERLLTADKFETMFATNHLGPFLLTHLLLDRLKASPDARILNVTAPSTSALDFDNLQGERAFNPLTVFGRSKMCNLLFTYELARRLKGTSVTANALLPGLVKSSLMQEAFIVIRWLSALVSRPPTQAAESAVYWLTAAQAKGATGELVKGRQIIQSNAYSHDLSIQQRLWVVSERLCGIAT
jgi:NAD(P)-dependent dehydrogenase (short-subunit alcohol dehydrogenase family)